jgi:hypothetical protein
VTSSPQPGLAGLDPTPHQHPPDLTAGAGHVNAHASHVHVGVVGKPGAHRTVRWRVRNRLAAPAQGRLAR